MEIRGIQVIEVKTVIKKKKIETIKRIRSSRKIIGIVINHRERERERERETDSEFGGRVARFGHHGCSGLKLARGRERN